ncbi:hypothetical protein IHE45_08G104700 [Dioscorea alata]|uniref:Uncharacterized protein n=1 Tax=Dioscorea alata TaxID=55571 RepID=A0ACB7VL42_DIOAL|nr:hypothetical protein IHE45_08G104700 [Dioscorea alata]
MVRMPNTGEMRPESLPVVKAMGAKPMAVKMEVEDHLEEEHGPLSKRSKLVGASRQWSEGAADNAPSEAVSYNVLNEPSPLGLRLRKSPSLLDLIQMRLSQANSTAATCISSCASLESGKKKDLKSTAASAITDKLKASNFPASLLRIGSWECVSRYEGDLVAKCYYAKHKLVWEVLEGGLKSKIEIQWSDITALKASCPDNGTGTLDVVLARQPLFFRETNPQPRKHTLWQATSDFTGGQASIHRRHFLQCPQGLLGKHFEKLIQCDPRLYSLSQKAEIIIESPYFEPRCSVFEDPDDSKRHAFDNMDDDVKPTFSGFHEPGSPSDAPSTSNKSKSRDLSVRAPDREARETPSPSSVMDTRAIEDNACSEPDDLKDRFRWDQLKVPGLNPSMSMRDLANHLEQCISEQMISGDPGISLPSKGMLEELTQYLLSDTQGSSASDELSLMSRVNSLCCLLQKDGPTAQNFQTSGGSHESLDEDGPQAERSEAKQQSISRKESFGDLLLHLPRIASMPQFLFNISEED